MTIIGGHVLLVKAPGKYVHTQTLTILVHNINYDMGAYIATGQNKTV